MFILYTIRMVIVVMGPGQELLTRFETAIFGLGLGLENFEFFSLRVK